jgi:hypothetical protein
VGEMGEWRRRRYLVMMCTAIYPLSDFFLILGFVSHLHGLAGSFGKL